MTGSAIVWLIVAAILCIVEAMTVALVSIWMAISAFAAAVIAILGGNVLIQIIGFLLFSAVLMVATIPLSKRIRKKNSERTNADRIIGAEGVVIERIDAVENKGKIKVMGQIWSASEAGHGSIDIGEKVVVRAIQGVRTVVEKI